MQRVVNLIILLTHSSKIYYKHYYVPGTLLSTRGPVVSKQMGFCPRELQD